MKTKMLIIVTAGLLVAADAPKDDAAVKEVEKAITVLNEAFTKNDADAIQRLMTEDHVAITPYYGGIASRAEQLKSLPEFKVAEYKASGLKVTLVSKDVALVTYALRQKGSYKGKALAAKSYAAAVWVRRDGHWREASYQETPVDDQ
jgi:uncharacterized protein (TIGR02246 family)